MPKLKYFWILILLCCLTGCIFGRDARKTVVRKDKGGQASRILDSQRLKRGGRLFISSFKAGVNVEATEELQQISLRIIKGIHDKLADHPHPFEIAAADNPGENELKISGFVSKLQGPGLLDKWLPVKGGNIALGVEGRMWDEDSGELVLFFIREKGSREGQEDYKSLAYQLGREIGSFIVEGLD